MNRAVINRWSGALLALAAALALPPAQADTGRPGAPRSAAAWSAAASEDANHARVIVKYRPGAALLQDSPQRRPLAAGALGRRLALPLIDGRVLGERMQALQGSGLSSRALAARLAAQADVEWAVVDQRRTINALQPNPPNDPYFAANQTSITPTVGQWYLRAPDSSLVSATNALGAWALTTGSPNITVAVIDTGVRLDHPDLVGKLWPGYDFISRTSNSSDSDGRDADPSDPGDWSTAGDTCGQADSSWHGTQVAGLIGAATDNALGMAGLGRNVMVLPVRALGKCGGFDSDILAGMRWAAGVSSDPYANPHPARVVNMSLGAAGSCSSAYNDVINELSAAKVAVVVAAGNDTGQAVNSPANCAGAIAVAGLRHAGTKVGYSNIGPQVAIAAPAGNCVNISANSPCLYPLLTTINTGLSAAATNTYSDSYNASLGTSFSAPLVSGTVALMLSLDPTLTPTTVKAHLQASARPFPSTGGSDGTVQACAAPSSADQLECYCSTSTCGAGMLDTGGAVDRVQQALLAPRAAIVATTATLTIGQTLLLDAAGSSASSGRNLAGYQWRITSGGNLASLVGATNGPSVTLSATAAGNLTVQLTVTDSVGASGSTSLALVLQATPPTPATGSGGSSGGGALGLGWLAGLALALAALRRSPAARRH